MTKLFKIKRNFKSICFIFFFSLASCSSNLKNDENLSTSLVNENDGFIENHFIKKLLKNYRENSNEINFYKEYIKTFGENELQQLKYSLTFKSFFHKKNNLKDDKNLIEEKSETFIFKTLTENWLWYLKKINKMFYLFNPYIEGIENFDNEEESFKNKLIFIQNLNKNIKNIYEINLKNLNQDVFANKKVFYLEYDNNFFIKIYYLKKINEKTQFLVYPDLYQINLNNNKKEFLEKFELDFFEKIKSKIYENETENDEEIIQTNESLYKDLNYWNIFDSNYTEILSNLIKEINFSKKNLIIRYTLRMVNDKNT